MFGLPFFFTVHCLFVFFIVVVEWFKILPLDMSRRCVLYVPTDGVLRTRTYYTRHCCHSWNSSVESNGIYEKFLIQLLTGWSWVFKVDVIRFNSLSNAMRCIIDVNLKWEDCAILSCTGRIFWSMIHVSSEHLSRRASHYDLSQIWEPCNYAVPHIPHRHHALRLHSQYKRLRKI